MTLKPILGWPWPRSALIAAAFLSLTGAQPHAQGLRIGRSIAVSSDMPSTWHYEVTMCADPTTPGHLVAASLYYGERNWLRNALVYASSDGGKTWKKTLDTPSTVDPSCAFSDDGHAYLTFMSLKKPLGAFN